MKRKARITLAALVLAMCAATAGKAQEGLYSSGPVPDDLKMTFEQLYESDMARATEYAGGKVKDKQAVRQLSWHISKLLSDGRVVYGDPITRMVERIADTLLRDWPELRAELRFYTVKSPDVNAFATAQGMIFVNAGLVAQVNNEAELAFILSHEIVHYYRNHSMEELVGRKKKNEVSTIEDDSEEMNEFLRRHRRSREMEAEADSLGLELFFLPSPYDKGVMEGVFDVLQYSELPFDEVPFDTTFFATPYYDVASTCWLPTLAAITSRDDYDDSRSTPPNILRRRQACAAVVGTAKGGRRHVVLGKDEFEQVRLLARQECVRQELVYAQFSRAFYESYLLAKAAPDDLFANRALAHALYNVAIYKSRGNDAAAGDFKRVEGESQQAYHMLRRIDAKQLALVSLNKIWRIHRRFPADQPLTEMATDLMRLLKAKHGMTFRSFSAEPPQEQAQAADTLADGTLTKYERIKRRRESQKSLSRDAYALTDIMMDDTAFNRLLAQVMNSPAPAAQVQFSGADKQLIFSPQYTVVNDRASRVETFESVKKELALADLVAKTGRRFGIESVDFGSRRLQQMESDVEYNDYVKLNEWMNEMWQSRGEFSLYRFMQPAMDTLIGRYGIGAVNFTTVLNVEKVRRTSTDYPYLTSILIFPMALYDRVVDNEESLVASMLVDARTGRMLASKGNKCAHADDAAFVGSTLYDLYHQMRLAQKKGIGKAEEKSATATTGVAGRRLALTVGIVPGLAPNLLHESGVDPAPLLTAEWAVQRSTTLALQYNYQSLPGGDGYPYYDDIAYGNSFSLTLRHYFAGQHAPLGAYSGYGLNWLRRANWPEQRTDNPAMHMGKQRANLVGPSVEMGYNHFLGTRALINVGLRYSLLVNAPFAGNSFATGFMVRNLVILNLSVGFMPF